MDRQAALQRLKQQRRAAAGSDNSTDMSSSPVHSSGAAHHSAAQSHLENETYMQRFEEAFAHLSSGTGRAEVRQAPTAAHQGAATSRTPGLTTAHLHQQPSAAADAQCSVRPTAHSSKNSAVLAGGAAAVSSKHQAAWRRGPDVEQGVLCELSDRPILCSSARWEAGEVVLGCSDHALYVVDVHTCKKRRTLYSKTCGHSEWVTSVAYMADGRILSGGMDSKLWLWPTSGSHGIELQGHSAPISQVRAYPGGAALGVSCSYDKSIRLWDVGRGRPREAQCLQGHGAPVLELDCSSDGKLASGDRSGTIMVWDPTAGVASWSAPTAHTGHVTALAWLRDGSDGAGCSGPILLSGGQDGVLRVWDSRGGKCVAAMPDLHNNAKGKGAVGNIVAGGAEAAHSIVTCGADQTLRVLEPAKSYAERAQVRLTDFPYSLAAVAGLALAGCGDGSVHVVDIGTGSTLYALGTNKAAVRTLDASGDRLLCAGDDGSAVAYRFNK